MSPAGGARAPARRGPARGPRRPVGSPGRWTDAPGSRSPLGAGARAAATDLRGHRHHRPCNAPGPAAGRDQVDPLRDQAALLDRLQEGLLPLPATRLLPGLEPGRDPVAPRHGPPPDQAPEAPIRWFACGPHRLGAEEGLEELLPALAGRRADEPPQGFLAHALQAQGLEQSPRLLDRPASLRLGLAVHLEVERQRQDHAHDPEAQVGPVQVEDDQGHDDHGDHGQPDRQVARLSRIRPRAMVNRSVRRVTPVTTK